MDRTDYASALRRDGARMAAAAVDPTARVTGCPDWDVAELLWHTSRVHRFWTGIADGSVTDPAGEKPADRPGDAELADWFLEGVERCAATLERLDPDLPRWTWAAQKDVGFIQRRVAQETAVHGWDALEAVGREEPIERALAADGIDEFLRLFVSGAPTADFPAAGLHLHATDGPGEWLLRAVDGAWEVTTEHAKGAVAVRGSASDLLLLLWRRRSPDRLEVFGSPADLAAVLAPFVRS
ncbi:maleylpyruvate isomerase family mycothiol-dependent enzyme [Kitasatospora sp. NPDC002040]|uniref:maleylpyruvate isomerase family mycothiol-dependent enzyme n=1 Tax=Kitasatospora sp. NPDC002040 TaxID=3154661 RepID=UPI003327244B